jgi:hydrogenase expression/formation protein HypC
MISMCVAIPSQIAEIQEGMATVDVGGARRRVSLLLLPDADVGDYVLVHAGFAIKRIDEQEALETLRILEEIAQTPGGGFERYGDASFDEGTQDE